jgi:hypothetical protein
MSTDPPNAKRPRWGRRIGLSALALVVVVLTAHAIWGVGLRRRVNAQLAALRAAGEPVAAADFILPEPPDGTNAADDIVEATRLIDGRSKQRDAFTRLSPALPLTPQEVETIAAEVAASPDVLKLAEAAAAKPAARWPFDPATPMLIQNFPWLRGTREIANLLRADALLAHQQGHDDRAVARIVQMWAIARHVDAQPMLIAHLVALGIGAVATQTAEDLAPDLRVATNASAGEAAPAAVRALIAELLDLANQLPPTLDALVPNYLAAVPADPMAPPNTPLRYKPAPAGPIVYGIGDDATDDGGSSAPITRRSNTAPTLLDRWRTKDAVLHLTRQPRPPPTSDPCGE